MKIIFYHNLVRILIEEDLMKNNDTRTLFLDQNKFSKDLESHEFHNDNPSSSKVDGPKHKAINSNMSQI